MTKKFSTKPQDNEGKEEKVTKWQELYLQADTKKNMNKQDKNIDDIEREKNPDQFTFKPNAGVVKKKRTASP